jgi:hypothetical protein
MKFEINFRSSSATYLRGLDLLDAVRSVVAGVDPEEVHDSVYIAGDVTVEVGEEVARKSGHFQDQNKTRVAVTISKEYLKDLVVVNQVKKDSWSGLLVPVVGYDAEALLESWAAQGFPEDMRYPTEPDPEEGSEEF